MDASILVVVFLLVTAASLATYLLSQWSSIRSSTLGIGWVATSVGITLLLAAAGVVVLTVGLFPELQFSRDFGSTNQMRRSAPLGSGAAERVLGAEEATTEASVDALEATPSSDRSARRAAGRSIADGASESRAAVETTAALQSPATAPQEQNGAAPHRLAPAVADPWAATNCVAAINPDPTDRTRWFVENECSAPVALVFASCSKGPSECGYRHTTSWEYRIDGMILPDKRQRTVTFAEQTQHGSHIGFAACLVADPVAIALIGADSETRASQAWSAQLDSARRNDECLILVRQYSDAGRRSGESIEALFGANVPTKVRSGFAAEP